MTDGSSNGWFHDPELTRLRREWVGAFRAWREAAEEGPPGSDQPDDEKRAALRHYRDAEAAYFAYSRKLGGR